MLPKYSDAEIDVLFRAKETDFIERKRSTNLKHEILEAICAFSNNLPDHGRPGVIFIGQNDDGSCAGLNISDKTIREVANWRREGQIQPIPSITVEHRIIDGCNVIVIQVYASDIPPVRFDGRIKVRVGSTKTDASLADEIRLNEKRSANARSFDTRGIAGLTISDIDMSLFENDYLPNAMAADVLEADKRTTAQQATALRMLDLNGCPTPAAVLMLGKTPQDVFPGAYVQAVLLEGDNLTSPILDQKTISGQIGDQIRELDLLIKAWNRTRVDLSDTIRKERPNYPEIALRQLIRNAVLHRSYEMTNSPVRISWYSDRVEVLSPGGPFGIVTRDNFGEVTDYRNPSLADAMKVMGIVERFGYGIVAARDACEKNGNPPPEFDIRPTHILATIRAEP